MKVCNRSFAPLQGNRMEGNRTQDVDPGRRVVRERIEEAEKRKPAPPEVPERHPWRRWESEGARSSGPRETRAMPKSSSLVLPEVVMNKLAAFKSP